MHALEHKTSSSRAAAPAASVRRSPAVSRASTPTIQRAPSCACGGSCPRCSAASTLKVGPVDDPYEREADRVADSVMSARSVDPIAAGPPSIHRRLYRRVLEPDEKYDSLSPPDNVASPTSSKPEVELPAELQRSAIVEGGPVTPRYEASVRQAVGRGGAALPASTRSFMEDRLGWNLSSVRIHSDGQADSLARQVNARAFTLGQDIFFARSQYEPSTREGQRLLAHELTHVVQQSDGRLSRRIQRTKCSAYPDYDKAVDRLTYNCAGLALRTYKFTSPPSAVYKDMWANFYGAVCPVGNCGPGQVRFWLWDYDIHTEDDLGTIIDPTWHDFHIVGGRCDGKGNDPAVVYSKNGPRPIHGPGTGPSFKPAAKDRALDRDDNPGTTPTGRPLFKVRSNMREEVTCASCS